MASSKAAKRYTERADEVHTKLASIQALLAAHGGKQANDPDNWGFAGDLAHVAEQLAAVEAFLKGTKIA